MTLDEHIGKRLEALRRSRNLSVKAVSAAIRVDAEDYKHFEEGKVRISSEKLCDLSDYFAEPLVYFFQSFDG